MLHLELHDVPWLVAADLGGEVDLAAHGRPVDADHLFPDHTTWIGFRRGALLGRYTSDFLQLLAPHLTRHLLTQARSSDTQDEVDALFEQAPIPNYKTS